MGEPVIEHATAALAAFGPPLLGLGWLVLLALWCTNKLTKED